MTQFLTVSFSIRKPTRRKQEVLEIAAGLYIESAQRLLDWCYGNLEAIKESAQKVNLKGEKTGKYDGDSVKRVMPPLSVLKLPLASAVNEALIGDVASNVAGYLEIAKKDPRTQFPSAIKETIGNDADYFSALKDFGATFDDIEEKTDCVTSYPSVQKP